MSEGLKKKSDILRKIKQGEITPEKGYQLLKSIPSEIDTISYSANRNEYVKEEKQDIAVIGMAAVLPGAKDLQEFWNNLINGVDSVEELPKDRWKINEEDEISKSVCRCAGTLKDVFSFDSSFFNILPQDAKYMDPQERVFLQEAWHAIEDAGYSAEKLASYKCGVFAGVMGSDYKQRTKLMGLGNSFISARIAYLLNLTGPNMTIDTACSSSLVAIHEACQSIRNGECEMALSGGVNIITTYDSLMVTNRIGMLSKSGRCRTFDNDADGFVPSEGVGVILLKPLEKAILEKDHIYGIIRGSGVNYDGATNGIAAPSGNAQEELELSVYEKYNINPGDITYLEAHGTGTKLGDPIEISALKKSFNKFTNKKNFCYIGALKSNIGHTLAASGVAGIIKTLLCLNHKMLVPTLHVKKENEHIDFKNSPFQIITKTKVWELGENSSRIAGISSFGLSGINCHMILEEAPKTIEDEKIIKKQPYYLFVFSAKSNESLKELLNKYIKWLVNAKIKYLPEEIAFTLMKGRTHFKYRSFIIAKDLEDLKEKLQEALHQETYKGDFKCQWNAQTGNEEFYLAEINQIFNIKQTNNFEKSIFHTAKAFLAEHKDIRSETLNWEGNIYNKIPLPGYPFKKVEHLIEEKNVQDKENNDEFMLIDSIDEESCFRDYLVFNKILKPENELLQNHKVNNTPMFPAAGYIEMVVEAFEKLYPKNHIELSKIYWRTPLIVKQENEVKIELHDEDSRLSFHICTEKDNKKIIHAQGYASKKDKRTNEVKKDVNYIKSRLNMKADHNEIYKYYNDMGISYGDVFSGLESVWAGEKEALGKFNLKKQDNYILQPTVIDCALQTIGALACALKIESENTCVPFSAESVEVLNQLKSSGYAHVKVIEENKFDVDIMDETGVICVSFINFEVKPLIQDEKRVLKIKNDNSCFTYNPIWEKIDINKYKSTNNTKEEKVLIIYSDDSKELKDAIKKQLSNCEIAIINIQEGINNIVSEIKEIDTIYFLGALSKKEEFENNFELLEETQQNGVLTLFDVIKILYDNEYLKKEVRLVVITNNVNRVLEEDIILPYAASVYGLTGSIEKEFGAISANVFDIDLINCKSNNEEQSRVYYEDISKLIVDKYMSFNGSVLAIRKGSFYKSKLVPVSLIENNNIAYREKGVYLLLGGMGGIGFALAKFLAKNYHAHLILIGRSMLDEKMQHSMKELELMGGKAIYINADVSDISSMKQAVRLSKEAFGKINGAFHTALVLKDRLIRNMKKEDMSDVMASKVKGTVVFESVLKDENLDFLMFFSSVQSYSKNAGQANYAAASTFEDAMVHYYNTKSKYTVKVINWGFWGEIGSVCDKKTNQRMESMGIYSINEEEGMTAIYKVLNSDSTQVLFMKAKKEVLRILGIDLIEDTIKTNSSNPVNEKEEKDKIEDIIINCAVNSLGLDRNELDSEQQFSELGVDSISGIEFIKALNNSFNCVLKTTILFEKGNIKELTDYIYEEYGSKLFQMQEVKEKENENEEEKEIIKEDDILRKNIFKAVKLTGPGDIEDIIIEQIKPIDPGKGEVQVLVKAFSLNFGDLLCIKGLYPTMPDYPFIPGFEFSGVVIKVGEGVTRVKSGDEVIGLTSISLGAHSMIVNTVEQAIVKKPLNVTFEEACAFPVVFLTVHHIFEKANVKPGEKILIQTAAGGTGLIAVQYALSKGMEVYATAGSKEKLNYLANMGVKHLINYQEEDFEKRIIEMTNGKGVDVVINTLSKDAIQKGINVLASEGRYMEIAMTGLKTSSKLNLSSFTNNQVFYSIDLRKMMLSNADLVMRYMDVMSSTLEKGTIKATIAKSFHFNDIKEAYNSLNNRENIGKIVVSTDVVYEPVYKTDNDYKTKILKDILKKLENGEISTEEAKMLMEVKNE